MDHADALVRRMDVLNGALAGIGVDLAGQTRLSLESVMWLLHAAHSNANRVEDFL